MSHNITIDQVTHPLHDGPPTEATVIAKWGVGTIILEAAGRPWPFLIAWCRLPASEECYPLDILHFEPTLLNGNQFRFTVRNPISGASDLVITPPLIHNSLISAQQGLVLQDFSAGINAAANGVANAFDTFHRADYWFGVMTGVTQIGEETILCQMRRRLSPADQPLTDHLSDDVAAAAATWKTFPVDPPRYVTGIQTGTAIGLSCLKELPSDEAVAAHMLIRYFETALAKVRALPGYHSYAHLMY